MTEIVGVTSCATGIAHSYMAAETVESIANELQKDCKVEVQGALGIENELTQDEIENALVIIFANDVSITNVERFDGVKEKIIQTSPHEIIRHSDKIVSRIKEDLL